MNLKPVLMALGVAVVVGLAWKTYGLQGLLFALGAVVMWVMINVNRTMSIMRKAANRPIVLSDSEEIAIEVVGGRDISANFDMQSIAKLLHGDRILVTRAEHSVRFLHPRGWSYFATLRKKLRWNEGGS